jgi:penicillin amidase
VPTLAGRTRDDLAWALGYLHAQERFFQMDGQRRTAAGELAQWVGQAALPRDRAVRVHRFRKRAEAVLAAMAPEERRTLETYARGVNRGLSDLGQLPFEYLLLRAPAEPWTAEDTILSVYAMYLDLQESDGATERRRANAVDALGEALAASSSRKAHRGTRRWTARCCPRRHSQRQSRTSEPKFVQAGGGETSSLPLPAATAGRWAVR